MVKHDVYIFFLWKFVECVKVSLSKRIETV